MSFCHEAGGYTDGNNRWNYTEQEWAEKCAREEQERKSAYKYRWTTRFTYLALITGAVWFFKSTYDSLPKEGEWTIAEEIDRPPVNFSIPKNQRTKGWNIQDNLFDNGHYIGYRDPITLRMDIIKNTKQTNKTNQ